MKYISLLIVYFFISTVCFAQNPNTLSKAEKKEGWKLLFDGKSLKGWHNYLKKDVSAKWKIENEALFLSEAGAGNLLTDKQYENFVLSIEWKIAKNGNSGVMYRVIEDNLYVEPYFTGMEMQILDDTGHPDAVRGERGTHRAGALYDLFPPTDFEAVKPVGEWNHAQIVLNNNHLEHWLNGKKVVDCDLKGELWEKALADSKFNGWYDFGKHTKGHIALQDHGDKVWFRNIKIKELKSSGKQTSKIIRNIPTIDSLTLASYTGSYELDKNPLGLQTVTIFVKEGKLYSQINKAITSELLPLPIQHQFLGLATGVTFIFSPTVQGKVEKFTFWVGKTAQLAGKRIE
jgi:hypothetical protein